MHRDSENRRNWLALDCMVSRLSVNPALGFVDASE
jgi:hypothetical protein